MILLAKVFAVETCLSCLINLPLPFAALCSSGTSLILGKSFNKDVIELSGLLLAFVPFSVEVNSDDPMAGNDASLAGSPISAGKFSLSSKATESFHLFSNPFPSVSDF